MRKLFQSFVIDVMLKNFLNNTSKGSFRSWKKIVKVSFPSVTVLGSHGVGELRCGGVAVWRSCGVGEL